MVLLGSALVLGGGLSAKEGIELKGEVIAGTLADPEFQSGLSAPWMGETYEAYETPADIERENRRALILTVGGVAAAASGVGIVTIGARRKGEHE